MFWKSILWSNVEVKSKFYVHVWEAQEFRPWPGSLTATRGKHELPDDIILLIYFTFLNRFCLTPLTTVLAVTSCDKHWPVSLLTSSPMIKIRIIYTQILQKANIFPKIPRSEWVAQCTKMLRNLSELTWSKNFCNTCLHHSKNCPSWWCFLRNFLTRSKPSRSIIAAKR